MRLERLRARIFNLPNYARGAACILTAVFCLSTAPTVIRFGLNAELDPVMLLSLRSWLAAGLLWGFACLRPNIAKIDRHGLVHCTITGVYNGVSLLLFYTALTFLDVSIATILISLYPLFVLIFLALRGEPLTRPNLLRLGIALTGVYLLVGPGGQVSGIGIGLMIITTIIFALNANWIQWQLHGYPPLTITLYTLSIAALVVGCVYGFQLIVQAQGLPTIPPLGWGVILYTAVIATVIARLSLFTGIQLIGSGQAALLAPIETLLAIIWAALFLGERLSRIQGIGAALIISSALLLPLWEKRALLLTSRPLNRYLHPPRK
ncbi:MAG: DMT family transporter [Deinococcota bacterium]